MHPHIIDAFFYHKKIFPSVFQSFQLNLFIDVIKPGRKVELSGDCTKIGVFLESLICMTSNGNNFSNCGHLTYPLKMSLCISFINMMDFIGVEIDP